jgi:hypothetical protein
MKIFISNYQIYTILQRFNSKYKFKNSEKKTKKFLPQLDDIIFIEAYTNTCIYTNQTILKKENIIIKFKINNNDLLDEIISLNILFDEYKDLI